VKFNLALGIALVALPLAGCKSIGPATVARDRSDYSASISESWKRQTLLTFRSTDVPQATLDDIREVRRLLRLDPDASEFKLVFGATAATNTEVAILTSSSLHLMQTMASQVEVPAEDIAQTRAVPGWESVTNPPGATRLVNIHSSQNQPARPFVAVHYRDHWFWIDDSDLKTKRAFAFVRMLLTLSEPGEKENLPLITIPAQ
jgi:hypothetical protein